jgi:hypothetical protein
MTAVNKNIGKARSTAAAFVNKASPKTRAIRPRRTSEDTTTPGRQNVPAATGK